MKIAIVGYGKMGKLIAEIAKSKNHTVVIVDPNFNGADCSNISQLADMNIDCAIEFTTPEHVLGNIRKLSALKINQIIGTTGWYEHLPEVKELVMTNSVGFMYAANFSLGVNIFLKLIANAAEIFNRINDYDVSALEFHHNKKADSPSGTALKIADVLLEKIDRKKTLLAENCNRAIEPEELHFPSMRCGNFPGTHEVFFDSAADTISLKHTARNREGFAAGAVIAAEWLGKKQGFFAIDDLIADLTGN